MMTINNNDTVQVRLSFLIQTVHQELKEWMEYFLCNIIIELQRTVS